jgi:hypothetical protein
MASRNAAAPTTAKNVLSNLTGADGALAIKSRANVRLLSSTESKRVNKPATRNALADVHCTGINAATKVMQPRPKKAHAVESLSN